MKYELVHTTWLSGLTAFKLDAYLQNITGQEIHSLSDALHTLIVCDFGHSKLQLEVEL